MNEDDVHKGKRVVTTSCQTDCGARCLLKVHVEDGRIVNIRTDDRPMPSLKACAKGLAQADVVYSEGRIKTPMKRTGPRGSGRFLPISWEEALETICSELTRVKENYGPESVFLLEHYGSMSPLHGVCKPARRFFKFFGGCTTNYGNLSQEAALFSSLYTFGTDFTGNTRDNYLHTKLIILWAWNPLVTRFGPDTVYYLAQAKKNGARIVSVDPRRNQTTKALADQWIPIRPGTDAAMLIAMAHVMIEHDLWDREFIKKHTVGFDVFRDYVMGDSDGRPKTPQWAEEITGVPERDIKDLAVLYAESKPAALHASWAPGRSAFGEQYHRAASTLAAMTGNIGIAGGHASGGSGRLPFGMLNQTLPVPDRPELLKVHAVDLYKALLEGTSGGFPSDIKLLYIVGANVLNQLPNANKGIHALRKPEFIFIHELFMTPTARYADVILPVTTSMERVDVGQAWTGGHYLIHMERVINPLHEAASDLEIFTRLADRLGLSGYNDKTDEEWLEAFVAATPDLPNYAAFKKKGYHELSVERPWIAFREQIENPADHPFPTPSGKIEIYSQRLADRNDPLMPPIPQYIPPWEGPTDPGVRRFPLQLVNPHSKARVNGQFDNIPKLKAISDDFLWMHPEDARQRAISNGDRVMVFNDRGSLLTGVRVTDRIMKGVVSLDQGTWLDPDEDGVDRGGCVNVLTLDKTSPAEALACNSCLVEVERSAD